MVSYQTYPKLIFISRLHFLFASEKSTHLDLNFFLPVEYLYMPIGQVDFDWLIENSPKMDT